MPSEIRQIIENSHLFAGLDPGLMEDIAAAATKRTLGAHELLFQKGDRADALWGVLSGRIVIEVRADDGKEMVLDEFHAGDVFGEVGVLDFGPRRVEATAACPSELFRLERSHFLEHLQTNPELCFRVFSLLCGHLRNTTETLEDTALYKLPSRLAKRLLLMSQMEAGENGSAVLKVVQSDLARMMGVNREAVNRQLKEWEKSGWISIQRQRIEILEQKSLAGLAAPGQIGDHRSWGYDRLYGLAPAGFPVNHGMDTAAGLPESRFAGILAVSCAEYAEMLMTDSANTVKRIKAGLAAIDQAIRDHGGRVIWSVGERTLAEFADGSSAIEAALEIQRHSDEAGLDAGKTNPIFRIGIDSGDVFTSEGWTIGDPVNIAIRLTELPGSSGICFTRAVRDELEETGSLELQYLGKHELKNVAGPVSVFSARSIPWQKRAALWADSLVPRSYRRVLALSAVLLGVAAIWLIGQRFGVSHAPDPPTPSIAVLSFALEGDPENAYLADGLAHEIRTALSAVPEALVIGKKSSDYFAEWNATDQEIGEILRVAYILQGTVGLTGNELKVSSRLIETANGTEIWHHNYQGSWQEFSEFQADIIRLTGDILSGGVAGSPAGTVALANIDNQEAYALYLQARGLIINKTRESLVEALSKLERALELEPDFAAAHVAMADAYLELNWFKGYYQVNAVQESHALARPHVDRALALDPDLAEAYLLQATIGEYSDEQDQELAIRKAISLNPNLALAQMELGVGLCNRLLSLHDCLPYLEKAYELDPLSIRTATVLAMFLQYVPQRRDEALAIISKLKERYPDHLEVNDLEAMWLLAEGRLSEAVPIWEKIVALDPSYFPAPRWLTVSLFSLGETRRALDSPNPKWEWNYVLSPDRAESLRLMKEVHNSSWAKGAFVAYVYVMLHDWQSAVDALAEHSQSLDGFRDSHEMMLAKSYSPALSLAVAYKGLGDEERYRKFAELEKDALETRWINDGFHNHEYSTNMARLYALEGRNNEAMLELERLITTGPNDPRELIHPAYDGMRDLPAFRKLQDLQRQRVNVERAKLGLAPIQGVSI